MIGELTLKCSYLLLIRKGHVGKQRLQNILGIIFLIYLYEYVMKYLLINFLYALVYAITSCSPVYFSTCANLFRPSSVGTKHNTID